MISIVMTTWFTDEQRIKVAEEALHSWNENLISRDTIRLIVSDDGSTLDWEPEKIWVGKLRGAKRGKVIRTRQERRGVGASLNAGFKTAFELSPIVLYAVDDWVLREPFDLDPWIQLLNEREDVGIVRLGPPHPHLRGTIMPLTENWQGWGLVLDRYGLTVGHRPELFHKRYINDYGWFDENINAQECERLASVRYAERPGGCKIVYALPHPWFHYHLDVLPSSSHIEPQA